MLFWADISNSASRWRKHTNRVVRVSRIATRNTSRAARVSRIMWRLGKRPIYPHPRIGRLAPPRYCAGCCVASSYNSRAARAAGLCGVLENVPSIRIPYRAACAAALLRGMLRCVIVHQPSRASGRMTTPTALRPPSGGLRRRAIVRAVVSLLFATVLGVLAPSRYRGILWLNIRFASIRVALFCWRSISEFFLSFLAGGACARSEGRAVGCFHRIGGHSGLVRGRTAKQMIRFDKRMKR